MHALTPVSRSRQVLPPGVTRVCSHNNMHAWGQLNYPTLHSVPSCPSRPCPVTPPRRPKREVRAVAQA
eukprot:5980980-Prymnesium_polylepis.1